MTSEEDKKLFFSEAEDLIIKLEDNVLKLEQDPEDDKPVQELFFVYHTLKGLTAMVGLNNLSEFTHHFENFLEKNKPKQVRMKQKDEFVNLLFKSLDIIKKTIKQIEKEEIEDLSPKILEKFSTSFDEFEVDYEITFFKLLTPQELESLIKDKKNTFYKIYIQIQSTCVFKKVRLFIIFRALNKIGRICSSDPEPNELEKGNFDTSFEIYFASKKSKKEIQDVISEILEIETNKVADVNPSEFKKIISKFIQSYAKQEEASVSDTVAFDFDEDIEILEEESIGDLSDFSLDNMDEVMKTVTSVKVDIEELEKLMNYFGEVIIIKNQISQILQKQQERGVNLFFDKMDKLFLAIQEIIFKLKLVKVESIFRRYRRLVRDVSKETGKKIKFKLEGLNVEIDRKILESLNGPLVQLLRNAIYHGIESPSERMAKQKPAHGTLELKTFRRAGSIFIEIRDDGKGLNYDNIKKKAVELGMYDPDTVSELTPKELNELIFSPGFSTLSGANMISGRGMGLAIVNEKVKELGGSIKIFTEQDKGTTFTLTVPFSRAILKAQLISISDDLYAIPIENIKQIYMFNTAQVEHIKGAEYYRIESRLVPIIRLGSYLGYSASEINAGDVTSRSQRIAILCYKDDDNGALFVVDQVFQQMEVVIKPFRTRYSKFQEILGTAVTGDGSICIIIDVLSIINTMNRTIESLKSIELEI